MKRLWAVLLLLTLTLQLHAAESDAHNKLQLTDIEGKSYNIQGTSEGLIFEGMEGKVILLEFFGHRCPPCLASIPGLIKLQKEFGEKLVIVAVEVQGLNTKELSAFVDKKHINYITATHENARRVVNYVGERAQWSGSIPFTVLMDTTGSVQMVEAGMIPKPYLTKLINSYLDAATTNKETTTTAAK